MIVSHDLTHHRDDRQREHRREDRHGAAGAAPRMLSWTYIFMKIFSIRRARRQADAFEREFWSGADLVGLYQRAASGRYAAAGMERIFEAGFKEFLKLKGRAGSDVAALLDGTRRAMKATYQREMDALESHLSFLATVGSVSPYVGLFGTVWGIMNAFRGLSNVAQATLAAGRARHRRGADGHRHGPVRGDSGGDRVQPLQPRHRPARDPLRELHGGALRTSCSARRTCPTAT